LSTCKRKSKKATKGPLLNVRLSKKRWYIGRRKKPRVFGPDRKVPVSASGKPPVKKIDWGDLIVVLAVNIVCREAILHGYGGSGM